MENIVLLIYNFFRKRKLLFFTIVFLIAAAITLIASKIKFEEDISKSVPGENDHINYILQNSRFTNKIVLNLFAGDSLKPAETDELVAFADELADSLKNNNFNSFILNQSFVFNDNLFEEVMGFFYENLPVFLDEEDYQKIDSLIIPENIDRTIEKDYQTLVSPASFAFKKFILTDPLGINALALNKLRQFQVDEGYEIINGFVFTKNKRNLLLFIDPANPPGETGKNALFLKKLDILLQYLSEKHNNAIKAQYYGSAAIAVGNAEQIKKDIKLTVSVAIFLILFFIAWFFRKITIPLISFLPAVFGAGLALAIIFLIKGSMSTIALGIGSVLLGIIVDYAIYIFSLNRTKDSMENVLRDMCTSISICSLTSAVAFFSLLFVKSEVLRDLGLFAGISILGAALFSLLFLPHLVSHKKADIQKRKTTFIDKIAAYKFESSTLLIAFFLLITLFFLIFFHKASFETDMYSMNFLSKKMKEAEKSLQGINDITLKSVYVFASGKDINQALSANATIADKLKNLEKDGLINRFTNVSSILIDDSIQQARLNKWANYWTPDKKMQLVNSLAKAGIKYGFKKDAFNKFYQFLDKNFSIINIDSFKTLRNLFLNDMITETGKSTMIMSLIKVSDKNRHAVYTTLSGIDNVVVIDRQEITSGFVKGIKQDFELLVRLCLIFVTLVLILAFGRIETGIIAAVPMFISWLWTLGFMGMFGLTFNIFNIIVCTFVFGLGVDYSILMMRGFIAEYKYGLKDLPSYKISIFLSSFTTLIGVGALLLAKHPSLHSIALISIIGVTTVVLISYSIEPVLFYRLIRKKGNKRLLPITFGDILTTVIALTVGIAGSIILNLLLFIIYPLPFKRMVKSKFLHYCMVLFLRITVKALPRIHKKIINTSNEKFNKPSIIIANHQSHLDLPLLLMLSPNIIVLTTKWVWNNPVYALVIRYLNFYPVIEGYDNVIAKLKKKVDEGYSILVFPEGTRSPDSRIQRFHKGAFLLAERLNLDITPVIIHGTGDCMNKGENHIRSGQITLKIYPRIKAEDKSFGNDYHERTKSLLKFFRYEYQQLKFELETPDYFRNKVIRNYIYKGPVLEWYTRIKLSLENNYSIYNQYVPHEANIIDIGCGYGIMTYMLGFISDKRIITGIDYDNDKIELANNCISKNNRIKFITADILLYEFPLSDVFILSDVLHYIPEEKQETLIEKCIKNLNENGIIIIRDADMDLQKRHKGTVLTEFFSTRFGFNKTVNKRLYFFGGQKIEEIAKKHNMKIEKIDTGRLTSNILYILRKFI
jgi:1-acyl-sn-glycerol-3-phosphate acyltransferase